MRISTNKLGSLWMSTLPGELKLSQLCIPGTHDSITRMRVSNDFSPDIVIPSWLLKLFNKWPWLAKIVKKNIVSWSQAQSLSAGEQLMNGSRYFDLRIAKNTTDNQFYTCHGLYSTDTLQTTLTEISQFLTNNSDEIVILDCNHFYAMGVNDHQNVIDMFVAIFTNKITSRNMGVNVSLSELRKQGKQVIIIYQDDTVASLNPETVWTASRISSPWANKANPKDLKLALDLIINNFPANPKNFQVTQAAMTPDTGTVIKGLLFGWLPRARGWAPRSLEDFAKNLDSLVEKWLVTDWSNKNINIIKGC